MGRQPDIKKPLSAFIGHDKTTREHMKRKTIKVKDLLKYVNDALAHGTDNEHAGPQRRMGMCDLLEHFLMENEGYAGFGYLKKNEVPSGHLPGIMPLDEYVAGGGNDPKILASKCNGNVFPDSTRRQYYVHR
jgi:hypothetical protein